MHDSLGYMQHEPVHRAWHHGEMTFSIVYAWSENFVLPISHDEVVHGKGSLLRKMPGDRWQQLANLRAYLAYMWAHPGKQLLFMGAELGQESEWAEARELDWWLLDHPEHSGCALARARPQPGLPRHPGAVGDRRRPRGVRLDRRQRRRPQRLLLPAHAPPTAPRWCASPTSPPSRTHDYRLPLPAAGAWEEVVNTDAEAYTGSGVGNLGTVTAVAGDHAGRPAYADIVVPPLATIWLRSQEVELRLAGTVELRLSSVSQAATQPADSGATQPWLG